MTATPAQHYLPMNTISFVEGNPLPLRTPREACAQLRVTDQTLRKLDRSGQLVALRIGGKARRYRQSDIDAYLNACAAGAARS